MNSKKRWSLFVILGLSLLLGACAPMRAAEEVMVEAPPMAPAYNGYEESVEAEYAVPQERDLTSGMGESAKAVERMVIYNADMRISVVDPEQTLQTIIEMVEDAGGFVVRSNLYKTYTDRGSLPQANVMVRVPAGRLNSIMEAIKGLTPSPKDDVLSENVSGQDVTAEYTDLESRLRNLEAAEAALVDLMEQARDPQDVLDVFSELTYYRGEIEIVKGRMSYLEESADLSALSVDIVAKRSLQPIEIVGWEPQGTAKAAVEALIKAGQSVVDALIWFGIFCLPFLIPLGVVVYFLVKYFRKRKANKQADQAVEEGLGQGD
jgi:flavin-binding protein dodecin